MRAQKVWISPRKAAAVLKTSEMKVYKYAILGRVRTLVEPGENVRFNRDDVERLARQLYAEPVPA